MRKYLFCLKSNSLFNSIVIVFVIRLIALRKPHRLFNLIGNCKLFSNIVATLASISFSFYQAFLTVDISKYDLFSVAATYTVFNDNKIETQAIWNLSYDINACL